MFHSARCSAAFAAPTKTNGRAAVRATHTAAMRHEEVGALVDYLFWVRDQVLAATASLAEGEFRSGETVTTRDLRATLVHQLENEWAWRIRLSHGEFPAGDLDAEAYPTLDVLANRWHREEQELRTWFERLSDLELASRPPGEENVLPLWQYLVYVVTHGIQQFSEAAVLLTRLGHSPGEIGFLRFASDRGFQQQ
jgi:uncharacterized damage-inducible protein DinB